MDLAPYSVIALHHSRREREALINVEALEYHSVVLDGSKVTLEDLAPDKDAPDDLIARWRSGCEQELQRRTERQARWLERFKRPAYCSGHKI